MRVRLPIVGSRHNGQFADVIASFIDFTLTSQTRGLSTSTETCHGISLTTRLTTETQPLGVTSTLQLMVPATSAGISQNPAMNPTKYGIAAIFEPPHCQTATTTSSTFETLICQVLGGRLPKISTSVPGCSLRVDIPTTYMVTGLLLLLVRLLVLSRENVTKAQA